MLELVASLNLSNLTATVDWFQAMPSWNNAGKVNISYIVSIGKLAPEPLKNGQFKVDY